MLQRTVAMRWWRAITGSLIGFFLFLPLLWLIRTALTPQGDLFNSAFRWLPGSLTLSNFRFALEHSGLGGYLLNSLICAGAAALLVTGLAAYAAYGLVAFRVPFSRGVMTVVLLTQVFPSALLLIKLYPMFVRLHLVGSRTGLVVAYMTLSLPAAIYMMQSFLLRFPMEVIEAARIDGYGDIRILHNIVFPVARPAFVAIWLFSFMWGWNDLLYSLTLTSSTSLTTLGPGLLTTYLGEFRENWSGIMAASIIASVPVIVVFLLLQRTFVRGVTTGAVKG